MRPATLLLAALLPLALACAARRTVAPPSPALRDARAAAAAERVAALGQDGDWLVIRGYRRPDDIVATATNMPFSHSALYDAGRWEVLEADGTGVHTLPLSDFVKKAHRLLLVRPAWAAGGAGHEAVGRARALVGKAYDYWGVLGLDDPDKYYCTELVVSVYRDQVPPGEPVPPVVAPGQLLYYGTILYDSGPPPTPRETP